jgi:hypothetical protein
VDELASAMLMNVGVQADLESRPIYDPQVADYSPHPLANIADIPEDDDGQTDDVSAFHGRMIPRMPWEPIP